MERLFNTNIGYINFFGPLKIMDLKLDIVISELINFDSYFFIN